MIQRDCAWKIILMIQIAVCPANGLCLQKVPNRDYDRVFPHFSLKGHIIMAFDNKASIRCAIKEMVMKWTKTPSILLWRAELDATSLFRRNNSDCCSSPKCGRVKGCRHTPKSQPIQLQLQHLFSQNNRTEVVK